MLSRLPVGYELRVARHKNGIGFFAEIVPINTETRPLSWQDVSHGHTSKEAIENALARFTGIPETLYQSKDFGL